MKSIITIGLGASLLILCGCSHYHADVAPYPTDGLVYRYDYYPQSGVYFDPDRHVYFWLSNGAWHRGDVLPDNIVLDALDRVVVRLDTDTPYLRREDIPLRSRDSEVTTPGPQAPQTYTFLYYPHHGVYFDPVGLHYYWFEQGRWQPHNHPPQELETTPEAPTTVELDTPFPEGLPQAHLGQ